MDLQPPWNRNSPSHRLLLRGLDRRHNTLLVSTQAILLWSCASFHARRCSHSPGWSCGPSCRSTWPRPDQESVLASLNLFDLIIMFTQVPAGQESFPLPRAFRLFCHRFCLLNIFLLHPHGWDGGDRQGTQENFCNNFVYHHVCCNGCPGITQPTVKQQIKFFWQHSRVNKKLWSYLHVCCTEIQWW